MLQYEYVEVNKTKQYSTAKAITTFGADVQFHKHCHNYTSKSKAFFLLFSYGKARAKLMFACLLVEPNFKNDAYTVHDQVPHLLNKPSLRRLYPQYYKMHAKVEGTNK